MTSSAELITIPRTPSDIGRVTRNPKCKTPSLSLSAIDAAIFADTPESIQDCLSVQAILFPSGQWLEASSPWRFAEEGARHELCHRAHHRSAPEPGAAAWLFGSAAQAGDGLHQLEARARTVERYGHAQAPGRRPARSTPRS